MMHDETVLFFKELKKDGTLSRFGKTFKTKDEFFFFDTGTGKILECNKSEYLVLRLMTEKNDTDFSCLGLSNIELKSALNSIMDAVKEENIFKANMIKKFDGGHFDCLEKLILQNIQQVIFEVTERCNLRCKYCIFNEYNDDFRDFGYNDMELEIATKTLDYILNNSFTDELYVGFYGGEPLLRFDFIQQCVDYALKNKKNKKITFSMTTNATLMTKDIAEYFASIPEFSVMVSIDGDKQTHDENRVFPDGKGTFEKTFQGFMNLLEAYGDKKRNLISVSSVVSPPYTVEKFDRMQKFYSKYASNLQINSTYVDFPSKKKNIEFKQCKLDNKMPMLAWDKQKSSLDKRKSFTIGNQTASLLKIHKRSLTDFPNEWHKLNGCCIPGMRRLYVTTRGDFLPCERVGKSPFIGNINQGLDFAAIREHYVKNYVKKSIEDCSKCWASPLCGICYAHCFTEDGINMTKKRKACIDERYNIEQNLIYYHELMKEDPEFINSLNNMKIE